jgi:hypothetical protein
LAVYVLYIAWHWCCRHLGRDQTGGAPKPQAPRQPIQGNSCTICTFQGFALFLIAVFVVIFTAIVFAFIQSIKRDRREAEIEMERIKRPGGYAFGSGGRVGGISAGVGQANAYAAPVAPVYAPVMAPGYSGSDVALGLVAGAALGSVMSHHDTVIVDHGGGYMAPAYVEPAYDSGISYDSGPSYSGGSDGGIDFSFGGGSD